MKKIGLIWALVLASLFYGCKNNNTLVMATAAEFPPFEYKEGQDFRGIDIEIGQEIAKRLNKKLEIKDMEFDSVITAISTGNADFGISGLTINATRKKVIDFSLPYYNAAQVIITKQDNKLFSDAGNEAYLFNQIIAQQEGIRIGVQTGTTGAFYAKGDSDWGFKGFANADIKSFVNGALAVSALVNDQVDLVIFDEVPARILSEANPDTKVLDAFLTNEEYGIGVNKNNPELLKQINQVLIEIERDGTLQNIIKKYF